ncbi:MAG: hypothetical protein ACRDK8_02815 [Solirubrobacteraceae bacterium]
MSDAARERAINLARWDELAEVHGEDDYYDSAALIAGADSLTEEESDLAGEVAGLDVILGRHARSPRRDIRSRIRRVRARCA